MGVSELVSANIALVDGAQGGDRMQGPARVLANELGALDTL